MTIVQADGTCEDVSIRVKYVPDICMNILSMNRLIEKGFSVSNEGSVISMKKGKIHFKFDQVLQGSGSNLRGIRMIGNEESSMIAEQDKPIPIMQLHHRLGHANEATVRKTAKEFGWKIGGKFTVCVGCSIAKAKQKDIPKLNDHVSKTKGERLCIDISSVKGKSFGGGRFWLLVVDEATDFKWSFFLKEKSKTSKTIRDLIRMLKTKHNIEVKFIRCDNAGENKGLEKDMATEFPKVVFEFTAPGTPQQNGKVERAFATMYGKVRSMLNTAGFSGSFREGLWAECARTATHLENLLHKKDDLPSSYSQFFGEIPKWMNHLRSFGEMAVVTTNGVTLRSKLRDRGVPMIFVGYTDSHAAAVFRFVNVRTKKLVLSRDVRWLRIFYGEFASRQLTSDVQGAVKYVDLDDTPEQGGKTTPLQVGQDMPYEHITIDQMMEDPTQVQINQDPYPEQEQGRNQDGANPEPEQEDRRPRMLRELRGLRTFYNNEVQMNLWETGETKATDEEFFNMAMASIENKSEPLRFQSAWNHPNEKEKDLWREAVRKELRDMRARNVWRKVPKMSVPKYRRLVGCRWVFEIKRDGRHRARLVAQGYSQIPGVDYTDCFAPVVNDVTFRMLLVIMMVKKYECIMIDVETAFLHGDLEEEVYMKIPEGYEDEDDDHEDSCLLLLKSTYGLTESARQWWKKFVSTMKTFGFKVSEAEPCLLFKRQENGECFVVVYVDDCLVMGNEHMVKHTIERIKEVFKIKEKGNLEDYLGCEVLFNRRKTQAWIGQPHLIKNLEEKFGEEATTKRLIKTPGTPRYVSVRTEGEDLLEKQTQERYRSGVGMLLYLVKHSRPDVANAVRELSRTLDKPNPAQYKEMLRIIRYVLDTQKFGLKIEPKMDLENGLWTIRAFSDSEFGGNPDNRISIGGWIIYFQGVPVLWCSRAMRSVTLSSTEAEYVAMSEAVKDLIFMRNILKSVGFNIEYPMIVEVDNTGAIYLGVNRATGQRTKHIDIRYHYVREFIDEGIVKVVFVSTKENDADVFTKNVTAEIYERMKDKVLMQKEDLSE